MNSFVRKKVVPSLIVALLSLGNASSGAEEHMVTLQVAGLKEPVEILTDRWGIAHIYAKNQDDLFFAQGYNAARDRLFQFEIWRRRVTGTMAEIQGPKALDRDIGARLLRFRGDLTQEMNHYHPQGERIIRAFVAGVNAYIQQTEEQPELLPIEFRLLGITPRPWTPAIVLSRIGGLFLNLETEVLMAARVRGLGAEQTRALADLHPGNPRLVAAEGLDLATIPADVLRYYQAARAQVTFSPEDVVDPAARAEGPTAAAVSLSRADPLPYSSQQEGSNNWVLSGTRTLTRRPLMANDPHRVITVPSLRYWVHLVAPGWNVIGGGEPHLPGVSIGHNEHGAWGLTIFPTDAEDLYVYDTNPDNPNQYRYRGQWEAMQIFRETIAVKGHDPVTVDLKYTRHGPVLAEDVHRRRAFALRAAWLEVGATPYLASLRMNQATNWEEFREACLFSYAPSENMVWADTRGNIGWQATGLVPRRPHWNGLLPVPGDGRFEWDGFLPAHELPSRHNPPEGFLATANQENLPHGYPHAVSYVWEPPYRFARISEVLHNGRMMTLVDMMRLQNDELSLPARMLVPLLWGLRPESAAAQAALQRLTAWDYVLRHDSVAAGIYAAWQQRLWANFLARHVPEPLRPYFPRMTLGPVIDSLLAPDGTYGPHPIAGRDQFLLDSFEQAVQELTERFGADMSRWTYGQAGYHHITIRHMLSGAVNSHLRQRFDIGPIPRGGDGFTVNNTDNNAGQSLGASFRIIADLADWDRSLGVNTPGQSGDPASPHYRDLVELWAQGKYFPIFYSREKIETVTDSKTLLQPRSPGAG
ncbi:MAG: penicillin acylase family protein [Thermodesulfobacteriota bacterium]|jgi:penicillin amidase